MIANRYKLVDKTLCKFERLGRSNKLPYLLVLLLLLMYVSAEGTGPQSSFLLSKFQTAIQGPFLLIYYPILKLKCSISFLA
jgi:hypothetical protein